MTTTPTAPLTLDAAPGVESCVAALVHALQQEKGWLHGYADSIIRDAIDRVHLDAAPEQLKGAFPARILSLLKFVADRNPPEGMGPYEDEHGKPMQDDADAAIRWLSEAQSALSAQAATITQLEARLREAEAERDAKTVLFKLSKLGHEQAFAHCQQFSGLLRRSIAQLSQWQRKYGEHNPSWLPPDGDVKLAEDIDAAIAAHGKDGV